MNDSVNHCRSCKYWAKRDNMIGVGVCCNAYVTTRIIIPVRDAFFTAQNFGCVLHETGERMPSIYNPEEAAAIVYDFNSNTP